MFLSTSSPSTKIPTTGASSTIFALLNNNNNNNLNQPIKSTTPFTAPSPISGTTTGGGGGGGFQSPFNQLITGQPQSHASRGTTPTNVFAATTTPGPIRTSTPGNGGGATTNATPQAAFVSPFSSLASTPQHSSPATTFPIGPTSSSTPSSSAVSSFPPPSFGSPPNSTAASLLSFPAPSFNQQSSGGFPLHFASAPTSHATSNPTSLPSSHLNSAPATQFPSQYPSIAPSRFGSAPTSVVPSKSASPQSHGLKGEPPNFAPLGGSLFNTHVSASSSSNTSGGKGSVGLFSTTPSPHSQVSGSGATPFSFPQPSGSNSAHRSLNGTPSATPNNLSLPSSLAPSPAPSPRLFGTPGPASGSAASASVLNLTERPSSSSAMVFPKPLTHPGSHLRPLIIHSENSSARSTPVVSGRSLMGGGSTATTVRPSPASSIAEGSARAEELSNLPALIPTFPDSLRAVECSSLASMLAPGGLPTPKKSPTAFFSHTIIPSSSQAASAAPSPKSSNLRQAPSDATPTPPLATILEQMSFSLGSLVLAAAASAVPADPSSSAAAAAASVFADHVAASSTSEKLTPFDFSAPSPDDREKARLQALGTPNRAATTDAPSLEAKQAKLEKAQRKLRTKGSGGRVAKDDDEEDDEDAFMYSTERRAQMGGLLSLSSGSVGAGSSSNPTTILATASKSMFSSRPFTALYRSLVTLKRTTLDEFFRGAHIAAFFIQQLVREPRRRELARQQQKQDSNQVTSPTAASSSSTPSTALDSVSFASAEEPFLAKGTSTATATISSFTPTAMPYQIASLHQTVQRVKYQGAEKTIEFASAILPPSIQALYERKLKLFQAERISLPSPTTPLTEQPLELVTPTSLPPYLSSLASLNMLVVGAPQSGVSTLLGNLLFQLGRLPFSLVKPKNVTANYWEEFNGQQFQQNSLTSSSSTNPNSKLNAWNAAKYNYKNYVHCFYTNRYRINLYHSNMGGIVNTTSSSSTPSKQQQSQQQQPTPQQANLSILAALQCDFILLIVDASAGAAFQPTILMQQQLLLAYLMGVRHVIICCTKLDAGNIAWSEKKVQASIATVISSFLKPLGFTANNIVTIPVSGLTGENLVQRQSKELTSWYDGPTLHQLIDRVTLPLHRQVESIADRKLCLQVMERPIPQQSILNEDTLDSVRVRIQVLSGLLLCSEPLALLTQNSVRGPIGPVGLKLLEREERSDSRDLAVYVDETEEAAASTDSSTASSKSSSTTTPTVKKLTHDATGKKLTNAERKVALAANKREHARLNAKEKKKSTYNWQQQQSLVTNDQEADEDQEVDEEQEEDGDQESNQQGSSLLSPTSSSSLTSASDSTNPSLTLTPSPFLTPGETGFITLSTLRPPASNADDDLTTLLTGRNAAESIATHSKDVLEHIAKSGQPGDMFTLPLDGNDGIRPIITFKAEILALTTWSVEMKLKAGQGVTLIPLRATLPSPANITANSPPSLWTLLTPPPTRAQPLGCSIVIMDRLVNILNKSSRAVLRKKPEYLCGPNTDGVCSTTGDLASVEFSSSRPLFLDTFGSGGPRLSTFLLMHQEQVIAMGTVTQINSYA